MSCAIESRKQRCKMKAFEYDLQLKTINITKSNELSYTMHSCGEAYVQFPGCWLNRSFISLHTASPSSPGAKPASYFINRTAIRLLSCIIDRFFPIQLCRPEELLSASTSSEMKLDLPIEKGEKPDSCSTMLGLECHLSGMNS